MQGLNMSNVETCYFAGSSTAKWAGYLLRHNRHGRGEREESKHRL